MKEPVYDVLIIGAGLSGIGMACHLKMQCPQKRFAVLERRQAVGGTWDLFRYPGIRSDSDMFTFGYRFRPWNEARVLADGDSIRNYIRETAREHQVSEHIQYGLKVSSASWSSENASWRVTAVHEGSGELQTFHCRFLIMGTGYYNYDAGYTPNFEGMADFKGQIIHPQAWPKDLNYAGKNVVVIGSGATAVTLVPAMAETAAHVTMLQRSPTYIFSLPAEDKISLVLNRLMPESWAYSLTRWRNILISRWLYKASKRWPQRMRRFFIGNVQKHMGEAFEERHFSPEYDPWDQRLCAVPDGDLFEAIRSGRASIVTDQIERFTEGGLLLKSGQQLKADIIITATGLDMRLLGGMEVDVDGQRREPNQLMSYKAVLIQDVPNFAVIFGYTNATWTLKADIASQYVCRLLKHMDAKGHDYAVPHDLEGCPESGSVMDALNSGYVRRASEGLPRQGRKLPWRVLNDYRRDRKLLLHAPIEDGVLFFGRARDEKARAS